MHRIDQPFIPKVQYISLHNTTEDVQYAMNFSD